MKKLLMVASSVGLGLTLIPSLLVFTGSITLESNKALMLLGTVVWFLAASRWLGSDGS
jgi:hypothetical protein